MSVISTKAAPATRREIGPEKSECNRAPELNRFEHSTRTAVQSPGTACVTILTQGSVRSANLKLQSPKMVCYAGISDA